MSTFRKVDPPFEVHFEEIGPERAQELLDTLPDHGPSKNRNRSRLRVARYAEDMEEGFWDVTHQGIAIDEFGVLMDGQHRLEAIVESGIPQILLVCVGVPRATFWLIDGGFTRTAASFLDGPYATPRGALARTLMRIEEKGGWADLSTVGNGKYPSHKVLQYISENDPVRVYGEGYSQAAKKYANRRRGWFIGTSQVGLLVGGYLTGPDKWNSWWEDVAAMSNGEGLPNGNPVRALYRCSPVGGNMTNVNYMRAIYAAVKYRDDAEVKIIREGSYRLVKAF